LLQTVLCALAIWLLVHGTGDEVRRWILGTCYLVAYLRFTLTILYLVKRHMGWEEALSVPFAFAIYYVGFTLLGRNVQAAPGAGVIAGVVLFAIGSTINTLSEILRDRWKRDPAHRGQLYTEGLFRYAVHINYFGDVLWVLGLALIASRWWSLIVPAALFCFFAFYNGPMLDRHLEEKYGGAFRDYAARTAKLVPFVW
jgi:steroid 5-alpha reductase family enzyme